MMTLAFDANRKLSETCFCMIFKAWKFYLLMCVSLGASMYEQNDKD